MFLVDNRVIVEMKTQYSALDKSNIDPLLLDVCNTINGIPGLATYACCQSHIETEEYPEYGSQFYVAMRASTADAIWWVQLVYRRFAQGLELFVNNEHNDQPQWVNPRLEIDETCDEHGAGREWSLVIRANVQSPNHAVEVCDAIKLAVTY